MSAFPFDVTPNTTGLPGLATLQGIAGAILTFGLVIAVASLVVAALAWAIGSHSNNPHVAGRGKSGVILSCAAALLIGASNALINFFNSAGQGLH